MKPIIFLDDGGVLSDNERRAAQWRRHLGEFLSREVGGEPAAWADANVVAFEHAWTGWAEDMAAARPLREAMREYDVRWMREMAGRVGVAVRDDDSAAVLTRRASRYVTGRVRAFYPEVTAGVRALRERGYRLHTASGALEADLDGYLRAEGVRDLFETLYGPDLVDAWKGGPDYYGAVFAHAGVAPRDAVVVDDSPRAIEWARSAGARALLLSRDEEVDAPLRSVADLARILD